MDKLSHICPYYVPIARVDEAEKDQIGGWSLSVGVRRFPRTRKASEGASGAIKQAGSPCSGGPTKELISTEWTEELWEALRWVWMGLTQSHKASCLGLDGIRYW